MRGHWAPESDCTLTKRCSLWPGSGHTTDPAVPALSLHARLNALSGAANEEIAAGDAAASAPGDGDVPMESFLPRH